MLTTCPECRTSFRITQAQLDIRRGMARCGHCHAVFNAYDMLLPEFEAPPPEPIEATPRRAEAEGTASVQPAPALVGSLEEIQPGERAALPEPAPATEEGEPSPPVSSVAPLPLASPLPKPEPGHQGRNVVAAPEEGTDAILLSELPVRARAETSLFGRANGFQVALNAALALLLLAQGAYFLRGWIVEQVPELRPAFAGMCDLLGCELPLARRLADLRVDASSLETDPEQTTRARLNVAFSNTSGVQQAWPHFILRLTDMRGNALAQRVFAPSDYLPPGVAEVAMAPMSEMEFNLVLDLGELSASGYEVSLHYP